MSSNHFQSKIKKKRLLPKHLLKQPRERGVLPSCPLGAMVRSDRAAVGHAVAAVGDGGGGARDGGEWIRQFDEDSQHFYMFNQSTGESLWEDDAADGVDAGQVSIEMVETGSTSNAADDGDQMSGSDDEADTGGLLQQGNANLVYAKTESVVRVFTWCFVFHGCCCEIPAAFVEGLARALWYFFGGLGMLLCNGILLVLRVFKYKPIGMFSFRQGALRLREAALFLAASVSLMIPCCGMFIYRGFDADNDWNIKPLWTIAGRVDPRRFYIFANGQVQLAENWSNATSKPCCFTETLSN